VEAAGACCTASLGLRGVALDESCGCSDTPLFGNLPESLTSSRLETALPTLYVLSAPPLQAPRVSVRVPGRLVTFPTDVEFHRCVVLLL
jgi:hypothetical protein